MNRTARAVIRVVVPCALAVACAHANTEKKPVTEESKTAPQPTPAPEPRKTNLVTAEPAPTPGDEQQGRDDLAKALAALGQVDVFFGFNDDTLTAPARGKLSAVGDVLVKHPTLKVKIDGNCDERGTAEYNLVLGQRRADVAKKYLVDLGVKNDQLQTISYGAEKPKALGHDEKSWQENRRDEIVPQAPAKSP
jgi:peptidoglycan-associated lipoprotein